MRKKSVKFNFIMNFLFTASGFVFPLITFPYATRILLPEGTGRVSFAVSVVSYFTMFAMLGVPTYGVRACAKVREKKDELSKVVHEIMIINLIMTAIAYAVLLIAILKIERLHRDAELMLVCSVSIILHTAGVNWLYQGLEEYAYITVRSIVFKFIGLVLLFFFVRDSGDYIAYGAITVFTGYGSYVWNMIRLRKIIYLNPQGPYNFKRHLKPIMIFFATSVATSIYIHLDTVMLGFMNTNVEVGYYNAAVKIKSILVSLITSLGTVLLPRLSYYYGKGKMDEFKNMVSKALNFVVMMAIPLMVYFIYMAQETIVFLSGNTFLNATFAMKLIMPTILFIGITNVTGTQIMVPMGKEKYVLYSVSVGAIVDFVLNLIFIPQYGASGAAFATTVTELVVLIVQVILLKKLLNNIWNKVSYLHFVFAVLITLLLNVLLNGCFKFSNLFIELVFNAVVFFGSYVIILWIIKEPLLRLIAGPYIKKLKKLFTV